MAGARLSRAWVLAGLLSAACATPVTPTARVIYECKSAPRLYSWYDHRGNLVSQYETDTYYQDTPCPAAPLE